MTQTNKHQEMNRDRGAFLHCFNAISSVRFYRIAAAFFNLLINAMHTFAEYFQCWFFSRSFPHEILLCFVVAVLFSLSSKLQECLLLVPYLFTHSLFGRPSFVISQCAHELAYNECNNEVIILIWLHSPDISGLSSVASARTWIANIKKRRKKQKQHTVTKPLLKRRENRRTEQKQFGFNLEIGFGEDKWSGNLDLARIEWCGDG